MKCSLIADGINHIDAAGSHRARRYFGVPERFFDIAVGLLILPLVAPVLALLLGLTRLDGGPGFFEQERVGRDGDRFTCWKLRAMVVDTERVLTELRATAPKVAEESHVNQRLSPLPVIS